jgi:hypothetical protein
MAKPTKFDIPGSGNSGNGRAVQTAHLEILENLAVEARAGIVPLPFLLRALVATATNPALDQPVCVVLPDVEGIAEIVAAISALVKLRGDSPGLEESFIKDALHSGAQLRSVAEGKIIQFDGFGHSHDQDWVYLHYVDAEGQRTHGRLTLPRKIIFGLEPTERKRPFFKSGEKPSNPVVTSFDRVAGTRTCGNTKLIRNRVILLGSRQQFESTLNEAPIVVPRDGHEHTSRAFEKYVWGYVDEERKAVVTNPHGTTGDPLVAVTQDALLLGRGPGSEVSGRILVTGRLELIRSNLQIVQRFAEGNRVLLLAPAARREDALKLRESGWSVWEPRGWELRANDSPEGLPGFTGLSRSLHSLSADFVASPFSMTSVRSAELQAAFGHISAIGQALPAEEYGMDPRLDELRAACSDLFYSMVSWLQEPASDEIERVGVLASTIKQHHSHADRCLGPDAAGRISGLLESLDRFRAEVVNAPMTPKGEALLKLAEIAVKDAFVPHAFVAGAVRERDRLARFLDAHGEFQHPCMTVWAAQGASQLTRVVAVSLMHRSAFARLVDPWPAPEVTFVGYDFETDIYERRLRYRNRMRDRLGLDDVPRSRTTGVSPGEFGSRAFNSTAEPSRADANAPMLPDTLLARFDRVIGGHRSVQRRPVPIRKPGEEVVQARYMKFCGTSWASFTEEHEILAVLAGAATTSRVVEMEVSDLAAGTRIIVRESGDKDVIREMAEREVGESSYVSLRNRAALWKRAIRQSNCGPREIQRRLARVGINRSLAAIGGWLHSESRIGPRSGADVLGIAEAFPLQGVNERAWQDCIAAISDVRGLHLSVGARLTGILATQCQTVLIDAAEHEQRVELDFGVVWIVQIAEIDDGFSEWPISSVNRIHGIERIFSFADL